MYKINLPNILLKKIHETCSSGVSDEEKRAYLISLESVLLNQEARYIPLAKSGDLHQIPENEDLSGVSTLEPVKELYDSHFSRKGSKGRGFYDLILLGAINNICPNCNQRSVTTLDHYLPKAKFGAFAISPVNLIPCCGDCNKIKWNHSPRNKNFQSIHPYFDDFTDGQWLKCRLIKNGSIGFDYYVEPPDSWNIVNKSRVKYHFDLFGLKLFYASQAGSEFSQIKWYLNKLYSLAGPLGVSRYLKDQMETRKLVSLNSWQFCMYQTLSGSNDFTGFGFQPVESSLVQS